MKGDEGISRGNNDEMGHLSRLRCGLRIYCDCWCSTKMCQWPERVWRCIWNRMWLTLPTHHKPFHRIEFAARNKSLYTLFQKKCTRWYVSTDNGFDTIFIVITFFFSGSVYCKYWDRWRSAASHAEIPPGEESNRRSVEQSCPKESSRCRVCVAEIAVIRIEKWFGEWVRRHCISCEVNNIPVLLWQPKSVEECSDTVTQHARPPTARKR